MGKANSNSLPTQKLSSIGISFAVLTMPQLNQQLKTYLEAVRKNRFGPELYTPTQLLPLTARASRRVRSDFDESSQRDESTEQSEFKAQQVDVLKGLWQYAVEKPREKTDKPVSSHVLLIGKPGSGKSTALHQLFQDAVQKALATKRYDNPRIPVLIELRGILHPRQKEDVWIWIQDAIEAETRLKLPIEALKQWQNWLLLFDGLNEAAFETLQSLHSFLQRSIVLAIPTICTTRQLGADNDLGIRTRLEMLPLNEPQMREFVQKYLPEYGDVLLGQLQGRLQEVAETPLLLKMLCDVFKKTQQIPQNKSELFQEFDQQYSSIKGSNLVDPDLRRHKSELLQYLAFKMLEGDPGNPTDYRLRVERSTAERWLEEFLAGRVEAPGGKAKKWLEGLQAHYLLQEADSNRYEVEFHHQLFQEYYAAEWLSPQLAGMSDAVLKCHYMNYLKWTEPLMMALALVKSEKLAVRLVELALEVDWSLGAKLAGSVQQKFQKQTVALIAKLEVPEWLKIRLLGETRANAVLPRLSKSLVDREYAVQRETIKALKNIGSAEAVNALLGAIRDPECRRSWEIIETLREIGLGAAERGLISLVKDWGHYRDDDYNTSATYYHETCCLTIEALGELKSEQAVPVLLQVLQESDYTYSLIVKALSEINASSAIADLRKSLRSKNLYSRRYAAIALGNLQDQQSISQLRQTLEDENLEVRIEAANALGKLIAKNSIQDLLSVITNKKSVDSEGKIRDSQYSFEMHEGHFRCAAVEAIGKIASSNHISNSILEKIHQDFILTFREDPDSGLREHIKESLSLIKSHHVARELTRFLHETKNYEYDLDDLIEVLGLIGSDAAVPGLIKALENEGNINASCKAAEALQKISSRDAIPCMIKALSHEDEDICREAAIMLGNLKVEDAIPSLLEALKKWESSWLFVQRNPVRHLCDSLVQIGGEKAISGLAETLSSNDEDWLKNSEILSALGESRSIFSIPTLVESLKDEDSIFFRAASGLSKVASSLGEAEKKKIIEQINLHRILALLDSPQTADGALEVIGSLEINVDISCLLPILKSNFWTEAKGLWTPLNRKLIETFKQLGWENLSVERNEEIESISAQLLKDDHEESRLYSAYVLTQLGFKAAALVLLAFIQDSESEQCDLAVTAVREVKGLNAAHIMPELFEILSPETNYSSPVRVSIYEYLCRIKGTIQGIQDNCQFYNYEIYQQSKIVPFPSRSVKMSESQPIFNFSNNRGSVNIGNIGNNFGTQNFRVDNKTDQEFQVLLADYVSFINNLQSKHQDVATEQEAIQIIDTEIKATPHWQKFLALQRLWNGGKKAAIAVSEHFAENTAWGKGAVAALEGVLEDPN